MNEKVTQSDILRLSANSGLMSCLFETANKYQQEELVAFCQNVVELVNEAKVSLFTKVDEDFLNQTHGPEYFQGVQLVCEIIPSVNTDHNDVLRLVETLVARAGEDFATYMPYTALKTWCRKNSLEARELIEDAECLDGKPLNYISFVVEGLNDVPTALIKFEKTSNPILQSEVAIALGRMTLSDTIVSTVIEKLSRTSLSSSKFCVCANTLVACYSILGRHRQVSRELPRRALLRMMDNGSTEATSTLASLLCNHGNDLTNDEWALITANLKTVTIKTPEILKKIDYSALSVKGKHGFLELADLIRHLIRDSSGQLTLDDFALFQRVLFDTDVSRLSKVVVQWLMDGNFHVCKTLEQAFSRTVPDTIELKLEAEDLPTEWHEQLFLCRKAVGWFFSIPISAASILIAVLKYGLEENLNNICEMLEYPLLINYYDVVRPYLEEKMKKHSDALNNQLQPVLNKAKIFFENLQLVKDLPELQPNENTQRLRAALDQEQFMIGWRSAENKSILNDIIPLKHLIYGNTWATYVRETNGTYVLQSQQLRSHSIKVPYPQLNSLDYARLSRLLLIYRNEQRVQL